MYREKHKNGKDVLYLLYHIIYPFSVIERCMKDVISSFHEASKDDPIMVKANLFGDIIKIHPFEDGNGRICCLILAHVLIQMKRILSSSFKFLL